MAELVLGDALEVLIDHRGKTPKKLGGDFTSAGVQVISALIVKHGGLNLPQARKVSEEMWLKWMPVKTRKHDVVLTSEAPLGRCALVPDDRPYVLGQRVFGLRGKQGVLDGRFLYYALQSRQVQDQLVGRASGTTVMGIRQSELVRVRIPAPGYVQQQGIATVLGALDDKIAVNERIAVTAENLCQSLFSEQKWDARTTVEAIAALRKEQISPATLGHAIVAHFSLPAFDSGRMPEFTAPAAIKSAKFIVREPAVLLSKLNPETPRVWNIAPEPGTPALASTEFLVLEPQAGVTTAELWAVLSQPGLLGGLAAKVTGTSKSHQRVRPAEVMSSEVVDPRELGVIRGQAQALAQRIAGARNESRTLAALRDTLLPQLMSGKLRVRDAERIVEDAV